MYEHITQERVRYGQTDQMGYLYYGHYPMFYEIGRTEAMRSLGLAYSELERKHGIFMPVVSMEVKYLRPAFYDDLLTIKTQIRKMPDRFITFHTELINPAGKLINTGVVKLCFYDPGLKRTVDMPDFFVEKLNPYFE